MKYLVIGLVLLAVLVGFCLWSGGMASERFARVIEPLEQAGDAAAQGETDRARSLAAEAFRRWEQSYPLLAAYLDHNDLDDVTLAFSGLGDLQEADLLPSLRSLLVLLRNLEAADLPIMHNLL